jgi:predicted molibdopterin-dependent oxidoreductase YjgC
MFRSLSTDPAHGVVISIDGRAVAVPADITVAAALLLSSDAHARTTPVSGAPRAPYCLMGACFDCLVEIDGVPNRQACMVVVEEAMQVRRAAGAREAGP